MRKLIAGILMLVCSLSTAASALCAPLPTGTVRYRQDVLNPNLQNARRWEEEERRRKEEERRRLEEERRRKEEEQRRRQDEQRRQDDERRRQEDERRRQEEERRRQEDERRRQEEERRRQEEERHRLDERQRAPVAPPPHDRPRHEIEIRPRDPGERLRARQVLRETGDYLLRAQRAARRGHYHFGLGKAYAHQEEAQKLYRGGRYNSAIAHSMRARRIAQDVIEANRPGRPRRPGPPPNYDDEIDNELSIKIRDDKAVLSLKINL